MKNMIPKKRTGYKLASAVTVVVFLALIIVLNIVVSVLVEKYPIKIDLTTTKVFEFSEQTKSILDSLEDEIVIYVIGTKSTVDLEVSEILSRYQTANSKVKLEYIDPSTNPTFGKDYVNEGESIQDGSVIVTMGDRYRTYTATDMYSTNSDGYRTGLQVEQKITSAINYVTSNEDFIVYFSSGNGETVPNSFASTLRSENFTVNELDLLTADIPENAKMLVIFSPKRDFSVEEITKLDTFMANGGQLQIYLPPAAGSEFANLKGFLNEWGLDFADDFVVDTGKQNSLTIPNYTSLLIPNLKNHTITNSISSASLRVATDYSRSVKTILNDTAGVTTSVLIETSTDSYARTNYLEDSDLFTKKDTDVDGPFALAVVSEKIVDTASEKTARIMLFGNDFLMSDSNYTIADLFGFANGNMVLNAANWMQDKKDSIAIKSKSYMTDYITLDAQNASVLAWMSIVIPIIILVVGFVIWLKRRHL
jgi:ABC-2 type transport system permease protein